MENLYTGRDFNAFDVGETFKTPGRTVTRAHIVNFAGISGDFNPLHMDDEFAKNTIHGSVIAHGALTFSICAGLFNRYVDGTCIAFLELDFKYTKAVKPGDTLHLEVTVLNKKLSSKGGRGIVDFGIKALNQNGDAVLEGVWKLMLEAYER